MPGLDTLFPFLVATIVFATLPGPGLLYTAAQSMAQGRRGGFLAVAGLHVGGLVHVVAASAGLSAMFRYVPELFLAVKIAGALYLVWLGITMIRSRGSDAGTAALPTPAVKSDGRMLLDSVVVEVLNPKTALFFIAFLPQFSSASASWPISMQLFVLGTFVNLCFSLVDVAVVLLASTVLRSLKSSSRMQGLVRKAGGTILAGLGVHMALSRS